MIIHKLSPHLKNSRINRSNTCSSHKLMSLPRIGSPLKNYSSNGNKKNLKIQNAKNYLVMFTLTQNDPTKLLKHLKQDNPSQTLMKKHASSLSSIMRKNILKKY